jgi:uncharacterized protein (DUF433 family)
MDHPIRWQEYIEERPDVMLGKPVFRGTRITVEHVLRELANGMSEHELLEGHPQLSPLHLRAAMDYAAAVIAEMGRPERSRGRFVLEAVRREIERRRRESLRASLGTPHPDTPILVEEGFADWAAGLPEEDARSLLLPGAGRPVRWIPGEGWIEDAR